MSNNLAKVFSAELEGIDAKLIEVEVDLNVGLHAFNIVGLADTALKEAKERVNSALKNSGLQPPNQENRRITINLAPADIKKAGSQYDLAIALGYMLATKQILPFEAESKILAGELALDGSLRPMTGAMNIAEMAVHLGYKEVLLPFENAPEASVISNIKVVGISSLTEAINILEKRASPRDYGEALEKNKKIAGVDFSAIKGQENAKRALMIAASGAHNLLFVGPPGAGKSLLAKAAASILPDLTLEESIEITKIYSAAGLGQNNLIKSRPVRSPHHNASPVALIGGGTNPKPGEISLAHRGVLFLDELPEFRRDILEGLRQPLEEGRVHIARARGSLILPAKFTLIAAMNPCPCGYFGDKRKECRCTANEVFKYQKRISGPLLDRLDLQINVPRLEIEELQKKKAVSDESREVRERVQAARNKQQERFKKCNLPILVNSEMSSEMCDDLIELDKASSNFLKSALETTYISARGYYRILKTARTIADLENSVDVKKEHLAEAFSYRIRTKE